jgi:hypothetical protein
MLLYLRVSIFFNNFNANLKCPTPSEHVTEMTGQLSTIMTQLDLVHGVIERLERSIMAQGIWDDEQSCEYFIIIDEVIITKRPYLVLQHHQFRQW